MIDIYREAGVPEDHVAREWWEEQPDKTIRRAFSLEVVRAQIAAFSYGDVILDEIHELTARLPVAIIRTMAQSVNPDAAWDQLVAVAPDVELLDLDAHHALPPSEQHRTAHAISNWLQATCPAFGPHPKIQLE